MANKRFGWHNGTLITRNATIVGDLTVKGTLNFGDAATDDLIVNGDLRINDDRFLHFGTDEDVSFEYDENGTNDFRGTVTAALGIGYLFTAGTGTSSGAGGEFTILAGAGGSSSGTGGAVNITSGAGTNGDANGGDITLTAGIADGSGVGGTIVAASLIELMAQSGDTAANALLMGIGTSGDPATTSVAGKSFMEFRTQSTATSGDNRSLYLRHELNGTGGGETIRAFTKVTAIVGTARGAHISIDTSTAGQVTGLGVGVDAQILMPGEAGTGGTWAAVNAEIFTVASTTIGTNTMSLFRGVIQGDATASADIEDNAFFLELGGDMTVATNAIMAAKSSSAVSHGLRMKGPDGNTYYIMVSDTL